MLSRYYELQRLPEAVEESKLSIKTSVRKRKKAQFNNFTQTNRSFCGAKASQLGRNSVLTAKLICLEWSDRLREGIGGGEKMNLEPNRRVQKTDSPQKTLFFSSKHLWEEFDEIRF